MSESHHPSLFYPLRELAHTVLVSFRMSLADPNWGLQGQTCRTKPVVPLSVELPLAVCKYDILEVATHTQREQPNEVRFVAVRERPQNLT